MKKVVITAIVIFLAIIAGLIVINNVAELKESDRTTVGLILIGTKDDKSYNQTHFEGLCQAALELDFDVVIRENVPTDSRCRNVMEQLVNSGCSIIICDSFEYGEFIPAVAELNPDVFFFHATGTIEGNNIASFFGRIYQMRYLSGIAAGLRTKTNEIGYIAAFDIPEVNRGINAFTLGVRSVNPDAVVYVDWCGSWIDENAAADSFRSLYDKHNIDIIAMHTNALSPLELAEEKGVWSIGYNIDNSADYPNTYLTSAIWKWENFYIPRIGDCIRNNFVGKHYWDSADTGIVALAPLTENAAEGTEEIIKRETERIHSGTFDVFYGPIYDNKGNLRIAEGESMSDYAMLNSFDWYVEGVVTDEK